MVQIIIQPQGGAAEALGSLMILGGMLVIVVVYLESRASKRGTHEVQLDSRFR
jgi:hypothetical protein